MSQKIRIGNDIAIRWSLLDNDEQPYVLTNRDVSIELNVGTKKVRIKEFEIDENTLVFTYYGMNQKYTGSYIMKFIENDGEKEMVTFDIEDAFTLVDHSWQAIDEGETPETVQLEFVTITSSLLEKIGPKGDNAGFGTIDAEIDANVGTPSVDVETSGPDTAKNIHFIFSNLKGEHGEKGDTPVITADVDGTLYVDGELLTEVVKDAVELANSAAQSASNTETAISESEALRVTAEQNRVSAEQGRVSAEISRASAESIRQDNEDDRQSAEDAREEEEISRANAESTRVAAENARVIAENERASAESLRDTSEQGRTSAESARVSAESGRADAETLRVTAESARVTAEQARASAESGRISAESERVSAESARVAAENARETQSASDHARAESDHTQAVSDHEAWLHVEDNYAHKVGVEDDLVAGAAKTLMGTTDRSAEFYQRAVPSDVGDGVAFHKKVKGKSLVWNQLANNVLSDSSNYIVNGSTTASYANGKLTVSFTGTGGGNAFGIKCNGLVSTHKYLFLVNGAGTVNSIKFGGPSIGNAGMTIVTFGSTIITQSHSYTNGAIWFWYAGSSVTPTDMILESVNLIDLTLMFGAGNEPATVEEFEILYPLPYYDYNPGTIINNNASAIQSIGFNQWDEEWELGNINANGTNSSSVDRIRSKNFIPVFPNRTHYFRLPFSANLRVVEYDGNHNGIGLIHDSATSSKTITPSANARYIRFVFGNSITPITTYNHDICINLSNPSLNGTYKPYKKDTLTLNLSTIKGKLNGEGESVTIFPDGMRSAGTAYDYIIVDADGYARKAVKVMESVDLGTLNYTKAAVSSSYPYGYFSALVSGRSFSNTNILSSKYPTVATWNVDKVVRGTSSNSTIYVIDSAYAESDTATFKTAMSGVMLNYELATPQEYVLDEPIYLGVHTYKGGMERMLPENTSTPITSPYNASIIYPLDASGTIEGLPSDYLSKESAQNLLSALKSAGVISGYTMTYDSESQRYIFTITA